MIERLSMSYSYRIICIRLWLRDLTIHSLLFVFEFRHVIVEVIVDPTTILLYFVLYTIRVSLTDPHSTWIELWSLCWSFVTPPRHSHSGLLWYRKMSAVGHDGPNTLYPTDEQVRVRPTHVARNDCELTPSSESTDLHRH